MLQEQDFVQPAPFFVNAVSLHYFKILFHKLADELGIKEDVTTYIARHVRSNRPE